MDSKDQQIELLQKKLKNCQRTRLRLKQTLNTKIHSLEEEVKLLKTIIKENEWIAIE